MYTLRIKHSFSAAHFIPGYPHECRRMHGHNYVIEAFVQGENLNEMEMLVDFKDLKKAMNLVLSDFDHNVLNELPEFEGLKPTSENLARLLYQRLSEFLLANHPLCSMQRLRVWESEASYVEYSE